MAEPRALVGGLIFVATYGALAFPPITRRVPGGRPVIAIAGGALMIAALVVAPASAAPSSEEVLGGALHAIDLGTLALLVGMMLLVAALDEAGFFAVLASALVHRFRTPRALLVALMLATAALSALFLNDAVVLLFTPVVVRATREMRVDPFPFLAVEAASANIGSVATPVGNPQNAFISLASGLSFGEFALVLGPVAILSLAIAIAIALVGFRRALARAPDAVLAPRARLTNRPLALLAFVVVALTFAGFLVHDRLGAPLWAVALAGGLGITVLAPFARASPLALARRVNVGILVFFVGLFVLIAGVRDAGLLDALYRAIGPAALASTAPFVLLTAALSNVVSNVPAVLLLAPAVHSARMWLALAAASTLAGNATVLGAAANVIVAEQARPLGAELDAWRFAKYGLVVTVATLATAVLFLR
ncbi:MAG: ArsB/NhaD family transporter [Thermoplasmatota archaeon]